ncbi:MAG: hypothetical protein Q7V45_22645 [Reyranella sp.]|nr:hypothetical protein [Reyranella sp.]
MSWQEVTPVIGGAAGTMKRLVRYRVSKKFGAAVTVPAAVVGALGWKKGDRLALFVGAADHAGKLRLARVDQGLLTVRQMKGEDTYQVNLGRVPQLPEREVDRIVVEHEASDGALVIRLPAHAQAIVPARPVPQAPAPGTKINVVDKVVGSGPRPVRFATQSGVRGG